MDNKLLDWGNLVFFFDIDDTLIDTEGASTEGTKGIGRVFSEKFGIEIGGKVEKGVNDIFDLMVGGYRVRSDSDWEAVPGGKNAFDVLIHRVTEVQDQVVSNYGSIKKWSREIFTKLVADDLGLSVTPELIAEAGDAYWLTLTAHTEVFSSALQLFKQIHSHNRPIYLITSSDARLKMRGDGQFEYIPEYSEALKRERIELLREKGLHFRLVSIGDPEDKPNVEFFEKGLKMAEDDLGMSIDRSNCIMFGDSFGGDLQTPLEKLGFGMVVHFHKTFSETNREGERYLSTEDLTSVLGYIS